MRKAPHYAVGDVISVIRGNHVFAEVPAAYARKNHAYSADKLGMLITVGEPLRLKSNPDAERRAVILAVAKAVETNTGARLHPDVIGDFMRANLNEQNLSESYNTAYLAGDYRVTEVSSGFVRAAKIDGGETISVYC